ncbi:cupin [Elizabethkingia sp. JS20170427COW]|uniref:cupin n=1 Tax=Elizabethkingia sp. JS20170427COW TaxID=2583851 RepID=UPI0011109CC4|nr:cupin [Elizabethkingia sp. JS20170427COW]QCX52698.1 cupin [Elizabethkingia sp. JS20170427COW]
MKTASLANDLIYNEDKPAIKVLLETDSGKEIRIALKQGQSMKRHQTPFPIVVEIFEGKIKFGVEDEVLSLEKGDLIALEGSVPHDLLAEENSIVRLSLNKLDSAQRVENVAKQ